MARINNKVCCTCGTSYKYCPSCREDLNKPSYMNLYCSETCRNLMIVASEFNAGNYSKTKAQQELKNVDINKRFEPNFSKSIKATIEKILKNDESKNVSSNITSDEKKIVKDNENNDKKPLSFSKKTDSKPKTSFVKKDILDKDSEK